MYVRVEREKKAIPSAGTAGVIRFNVWMPAVDAEFQQAMDSTTQGQISAPFRSQYGWHIVLVDGRRQQDMSDDMRRNMARNFLHQRKFQEELQAWLQKIRGEAYVDIKKS